LIRASGVVSRFRQLAGPSLLLLLTLMPPAYAQGEEPGEGHRLRSDPTMRETERQGQAQLRFVDGPPVKLVMTVKLQNERSFDPEGNASLAVMNTGDDVVLRKAVRYQITSGSTLKIESVLSDDTVRAIRQGVRVTLTVVDRFGGQRPYRAAAANPRLPAALAQVRPANATEPPAVVTLTLIVTGNGTVKSATAGIACSSNATCPYSLSKDIDVLTASPERGSKLGSSQGCDRIDGDKCIVVKMTGDRTVTIAFVPAAPSASKVSLSSNGAVNVDPPGRRLDKPAS
jgi:hypothetical protein